MIVHEATWEGSSIYPAPLGLLNGRGLNQDRIVHVAVNCLLTAAVAYPLSTVDEGAPTAFRTQAEGFVEE